VSIASEEPAVIFDATFLIRDDTPSSMVGRPPPGEILTEFIRRAVQRRWAGGVGSMSSSIYQEMRRADKELCRQGNRMRLNAERQAEKEAERKVPTNASCAVCAWPVPPLTHEPRAGNARQRQGDPLQQLRIAGVKVKPVFDLAAHTATEANEGLLPWNGKEDNLIDRFDGRALLDFYREPPPRAPQAKTDDELELEQKV
jgi:hypothetical protein